MNGRLPKPTNLKILEGNPGHRPLNKHEPKPASRAVCPSHLTALAKREWRRVSVELEQLGLLTGVDAAELAAYCCAYGRWIEAEREVKKHGLLVPSAVPGVLKSNPAIAVVNQCLTQIDKFSSQFGMTPASRSRISVAPPSKQDDPFVSFMNSIAGADDQQVTTKQ